MDSLTINADLSRHRFSRAEGCLSAAQRMRTSGYCSSANSRAYYCVFHAIRAMLALDGQEYRKRSAVLAKFEENYVKSGAFPDDFSEIARHASELQLRSDEEDFYVCTPEETEKLLSDAARFLQAVRVYLETQRGWDLQP